MLNNFIDSVLIIDDKKDEVKDLIELFQSQDVWTTYFTPKQHESDTIEKNDIEKLDVICSREFPFRNRKLIFLDLRLDESKTTKDNIQVILRPLFEKIIGKNFGSYGIVMWTRNEEHIDEFKDKIINDIDKYTLPLFIIGLEKQKYLTDGYDSLIEDLETELGKSVAASFFLKWRIAIENALENILSTITRLVGNFNTQNDNLEFLLYHMAKNNLGINDNLLEDFYALPIEAFEAFSHLLHSDLRKYISAQDCQLFSDIKKIKYTFFENDKKMEKKGQEYILNDRPIPKKDQKNRNTIDEQINTLFSKINSMILLDFKYYGLKPGNIYLDRGLCHVSKEIKDNDIPIVIELSPPCDYANSDKKRGQPKFVSGFLSIYDDKRLKELKSDSIYTEAYPIYLEKTEYYPENIYIISFDFRYINNIAELELRIKNYIFLFRAKDNLFADILQKMSSYTARLGLSIIQ
jgi:hypothetical protein